MENYATLPGGRTVPERTLQAVQSLAAALNEAGPRAENWHEYLALTETWAGANGFRAVTVLDPSRYEELAVPGSLVLAGGQPRMAAENMDGDQAMVNTDGALSFLPGWEEYDLNGEYRVTFFTPIA